MPAHSASLRAFTPVFDGLWTRVNALLPGTRGQPLPSFVSQPKSQSEPAVPVNNSRKAGHRVQPDAGDFSVSSRIKTGNGRTPAPVGAARLAGNNRAKQDENRKRMQPRLALRTRVGRVRRHRSLVRA